MQETSHVELVLVGEKPLAEAAFLSGEDPGALVIDARKLTFACPLDLAGIVATAHWAAESSIPVTLRLPTATHMAAYLQRMDVLRQMPRRTRIDGRVPPDARNDRRGTLMEVTPLNEKNVDDLFQQLGPLITSYYTGQPQAAAAMFRACSELLGNAAEHGASDRGAFMAVQLHSGATTGSARFEFAVCDTGIGVMSHLRRNSSHAHLSRDELAIAEAMKEGVSGIEAEARGNGLSDAIKDTRRHGRVDFQIRSGCGEVRVTGRPDSYRKQPQSRPDQTSGTWAWLTHRPPTQDQTMVQSIK